MNFPDQAIFLRQSRETLTQVRATISRIVDVIEQGRCATLRSRRTIEQARALTYTGLEMQQLEYMQDRLALTPQPAAPSCNDTFDDWVIDLRRKEVRNSSGLSVFVSVEGRQVKLRRSNAAEWIRQDFDRRAPLVPDLLRQALDVYRAAMAAAKKKRLTRTKRTR